MSRHDLGSRAGELRDSLTAGGAAGSIWQAGTGWRWQATRPSADAAHAIDVRVDTDDAISRLDR